MDILLTARPNVFKAAFSGVLANIFMGILGLWLLTTQFFNVVGYLFILYSIIGFITIYLIYSNMVLTIDREKTIYKTGVLSKKVIEVKHVDVRNIQIFQSVFQRIFDIGTVSIFSAGTNNAEIIIRGVHEYNQIKDLLNNERGKAESATKDKKTTNKAEIDIAEQIKKLSDLKDQEIITQAEFKKKKEDLLAKM